MMTISPNTAQNELKIKVVPRMTGNRQYVVYNSEGNQILMITSQKNIVETMIKNRKK
jgi:hypothetical protein